MIIPSGPMRDTPPRIAKSMKSDGMSVSFDMMYGFNMLSIVPIMTADHMRSPSACHCIPVKNKNNIAGTETTEVPTVGMKDAILATTAQIIAFGTPKIVNPTQASIP